MNSKSMGFLKTQNGAGQKKTFWKQNNGFSCHYSHSVSFSSKSEHDTVEWHNSHGGGRGAECRPSKCPTFWGTVPHSDNKKSPEIWDVPHFVILLSMFWYACHFGVPHSKVGCPTFRDSEVGRSESAPLKLFSEKCLLTYWEKRGRKKRENREESKKIVKEKVEILKWK